MNQDVLASILSCDQLPSLPAVAVRVIDLTSNVNVRLDDLAEVIHADQGLSAKIIKTVNSSFYGLRRPCSTINQALVMLGLSAVKSLALSFSLVSMVEAKKDAGFDYVAYWRRGLYSGVAAKLAARHKGLATEDEAFLSALLQDIGMVAMSRALKGEYRAVLAEAGGDHRALVRAELAALELQHPDVGAMLAQRWKLPDELVLPVKYHERPTAAPPAHGDLIRCVGLGNLAHDALTEPGSAPSLKRYYAKAREWLGIDETSAGEMLKEAASAATEMSSLFRLDTGAAVDAEELMARAREQSERLEAQAKAGSTLGNLVSDGDDVDVLTGAATRGAGLRKAEDLFESARQQGKSLSVLAVSIDGLTRFIEQHGPEAGDVILVETAAHLQDQFDAMGGSVCRWDGGLFLVLLPGVERLGAVRVASDVRAAVEAQSTGWLLRNARPAPTRVSVGAATAEPTPGSPFVKVAQLLTAAVRAAEAASSTGGNAVRAFVPKAAAA